MFGFIKAPCRACSAESASEYRQWFCGLGCALSRDYSPLARFLVNHDSTFLALAAGGVSRDGSEAVLRTCCNPFAKRRPVQSEHWATQYAAAVTICGLRVKADDEVDDERGARRYLARAASALSSPAADKATALLNSIDFPTGKIWGAMGARAQVETPSASLLDAASPTADAYQDIFAFPARHFDQSKTTHSSLATLGQSMGRLVYWKDALDDKESDTKKGRFNPLHYHREGTLRESITREASRFRNAALELAGQVGILPALADDTTEFHFAEEASTGDQRKKRSSRITKKERDCWCCDCCAPCECPSGKGSCVDKLCDCGPGDTGCIDCCPCDCS